MLLLFSLFVCSFFSPFSFLIVFVCFSFFGGLKGQVRWSKGPPHLALNPPCLFVFLLFVYLGGFKGEVAQSATSLGPKPSNFCFFLFFVSFCVFYLLSFLRFQLKKNWFSPEKSIFVYFSVSPFVSL